MRSRAKVSREGDQVGDSREASTENNYGQGDQRKRRTVSNRGEQCNKGKDKIMEQEGGGQNAKSQGAQRKREEERRGGKT